MNVQMARMQQNSNTNPAILLVFDDFASVQGLRYMELFNELSMNGRHYQITVIFTTQKLTSAATSIRANADKVFIFYNINRNTLDLLYKEYGGEFRSETDFRLLLARETGDNKCVVIDLKNVNDRGSKRFYSFKSRDLQKKKWSMLCDQAWQNRRAELLASQRAFFHPFKPQLKLSTMKQYKNQSGITNQMINGQTEAYKKIGEADFDMKKIRGAGGKDGKDDILG